MLNKGREITPNRAGGSLLPRVSVQGWPVWHRSAHFSSVFAPANLSLCQVEVPMSVCLEEWKRVFHPPSSEDNSTLGFFLSMSNHLLKCQVVFRKMRRITPLRMLGTELEKMFLSLKASSCPACVVAECAVHRLCN